MKKRTKGEWQHHINCSMGSVPLNAVRATTATRDVTFQTEFGAAVDKQVATVVSTADLSVLIAHPDDATLMRATPASLKRTEAETISLLEHVQHQIATSLQDAGVTYISNNKQMERSDPRKFHRGAFASRSELFFKNRGELQEEGLRQQMHALRFDPSTFQLFDEGVLKKALSLAAIAGRYKE